LVYLFVGWLVGWLVGWFVRLFGSCTRDMLHGLHNGKSNKKASFQKKITSFVLFHQIILLMSYPASALTSYGMTTNLP